MACANRPELASRFVFLADPKAVADLPPQSARSRVLARPIDAEKLRALVEQMRLSRG